MRESTMSSGPINAFQLYSKYACQWPWVSVTLAPHVMLTIWSSKGISWASGGTQLIYYKMWGFTSIWSAPTVRNPWNIIDVYYN